jgi:hypothetical protein
VRILYVSTHHILEYDDLRLLRSLGHEVFSIGFYRDPRQPWGPAFRPPIEEKMSSFDFAGALRATGCGPKQKELPRRFLRLFDAIIVMHDFAFLAANAERLKGILVIWRSIGQCLTQWEERLAPFRSLVKIARSSHREKFTPGTIGTDYVVRFYKDPAEWSPPGDLVRSHKVVTFFSKIRQRRQWSNYDFYEQATAPFDRVLYGAMNDGISHSGSFLRFDDLKREMASAGVYFCVHTSPASYTLNFIEAWMLGAPMICYGADIAFPRDGYEVPELIEHGRHGMIVNSVAEAQDAIRQILGDSALAEALGKAGRMRAIDIFGIEAGRKAWTELLEENQPGIPARLRRYYYTARANLRRRPAA